MLKYIPNVKSVKFWKDSNNKQGCRLVSTGLCCDLCL